MHKVIAFILLASGLCAQVDTSLIYNEVEVYGMRLVQEAGRSSQDVRVLDRDDVRELGARSLDELIQLVGGIEVQTRGVFGTQADITMRGSTFNQVLVLIDGQAVTDPLTGHFNSNIPISMMGVRRIEVIRGPSAAIYGPNAVGGVINIITDLNSPSETRPSFEAGYEVGDYDQRLLQMGGSIRVMNDFVLSGSLNNAEADGPEYSGDSTSQYFDIQTYDLGLAWAPSSKTHAFIRYARDARDFDARYYYTRNPFDRSTEKVDRSFWQGRFSTKLGHHEWIYNASFLTTDDEFLFNPAFGGPNEHTTRVADQRLEWKYDWGQWRTNIGAQYQYRTIESNDRGDHEEGQLGLFAIGHYEVNSQINVEASLRLDHQEVYDWQWVPQLGVNYLFPGGWRMRAMVGRSVRAADYTERYVNFGRTTILSAERNLGNPNLQTEKAWTGEWGLSYYGAKNLELGVNVFYRSSSDLIDYIRTPASQIEDMRLLDSTAQYFYAQNISSLRTVGLELMGQYQHVISRDWRWSITGNLSWISSSGDEDDFSKYLANHAGVFGSFSFETDYHWIQWRVTGLYKNRDFEESTDLGATLDDEYILFHSRLNIQLPFGFDVYGQMHNIFDQEYADVLGAELPGRWWSAGIRLKF